METEYRCLNCEQRFGIVVTEAESASRLEPVRLDECPTCGQRVGTGRVQCRKCGAAFEVAFPHWHVLCDLATGECPACGATYQSLCIC
jgi:DNA-directed RNA polymerase subunit RPC12/RpoP